MEGRYFSVSRCKKDESEENAISSFIIITVVDAKSKVNMCQQIDADRKKNINKYFCFNLQKCCCFFFLIATTPNLFGPHKVSQNQGAYFFKLQKLKSEQQ